MAGGYHHEIKFWQQDDIVPGGYPDCEDDGDFFINLRVQFMLRMYSSNDDRNLELYDRKFFLPRDELLGEAEYSVLIYALLYRLGLPEAVCEGLCCQISDFGKQMAVDPRNTGPKILPMVVAIEVRTLQQENENEDSAIARAISRPARTSRAIPTTNKSCIAALEKLRVEHYPGSVEQCAICLDKPSVGAEISQLPCSHIYHWDCIVRWLEKSNLCPLCRFHMPC